MRKFPTLCLLVVGLLVCFQATTALGQLFVPSGLNPGDEYRIAFQTESNAITATSTDIGFYNDTVNDEAFQSSLTRGMLTQPVEYFAVASTETVDARDNVGLSPAPIYLVNDTLLANGTDDLWNGTILQQFRIDQFGMVQSTTEVWTGSGFDGTAFLNRFLGSAEPRYGENQFTNPDWISRNNDIGANQTFALYAISEVLTVVPEPGSLGMLVLALGVVAGFGRRQRC